MPALHASLCCLAAASGFLAVAALSYSAATWPGGAGVREKWTHFLAHGHEYDVLLLGSSRVYRSFAPREMELEWKRLGRALRAYNLAAPGADPFEADAMLAEILGRERGRLAAVVLELGAWDPGSVRGNETSRRAVHWHTLEGTRNAIESCFRHPGLAPAERAELALWHLRLFGRRVASYGRGAEVVDSLRREDDRALLAEARRNGGYRPLEAEGFSGVRERRAAFLAAPEPSVASPGDPLAELNLGALERRVRSVRAAGLEVVFVVPPGRWSPPHELPLDVDPRPALISYSDRERYSDLYAREALFDDEHLNEGSARKLSRIFARDLLPHLP